MLCFNFSFFPLWFICLISFFSTADISAKLLKVPKESNSYHPFIVNAIPKCGTHCIADTIALITGSEGFSAPISIAALNKATSDKTYIKVYIPYSVENLALLKNHGTKIIFMYRDPRDALISLIFYMEKLKRKRRGCRRDFFTVSANFDSLSFDERLSALITGLDDMQSYLEFYENRMGWIFGPYALSVKYEDLVGSQGGGDDKHQRQAINKITAYLNMPRSKTRTAYVMSHLYKERENIVQNDKEFKRGSIGNWRTFFSEKHKALFKQKFGDQLIRLGYEKNNKW